MFVLVGVDQRPLGDRPLDQGADRHLLDVLPGIRINTPPHLPPAANIPKIGGFSLAKVPPPRSPLQASPPGGRLFFDVLGIGPLCSRTT